MTAARPDSPGGITQLPGESYPDYILRKYPDPEPLTPPLDWESMWARKVPPPQPYEPRDHPPPPAYAQKALDEEVAAVATATKGTRNGTLNEAAFALGNLVAAGLLDRGLAADRLRQAARSVGLGSREVEATLRSGLTAGMRSPRQIPPLIVAGQVQEVPATPLVPRLAISDRRAKVTWADTIAPRPVTWAWLDGTYGRIPSGSLCMAAGREGTGKSSFGIWMTACITRGTLPGAYFGRPRRVLYVTVEDSWEFTIAPRLIAAGADTSLVGRFDVVNEDDAELPLSLPYDNALLEQAIHDHDAALIVVDPIMSVLSDRINPSRVREVRSALDPLVRIAQRTSAVVVGIAHFNKGNATDPTLSISESKAFTDVPRSVFTFARDDDNDCRVMSQTKNSLGRDWTDLPSLKYSIDSVLVDTSEGPAEVGRFTLNGVAERSVGDIVRDRDQDEAGERDQASAWLLDFLALQSNAGSCARADLMKAARPQGFSISTLQRAAKRSGIVIRQHGYPKTSTWFHPEHVPEEPQCGHSGVSEVKVHDIDPTDPTVTPLTRAATDLYHRQSARGLCATDDKEPRHDH